MPRKGQARKRADLVSADTNSTTVEATRDELGEQYQEYVETHREAMNVLFAILFIVPPGILLLYILMMD